MRPKAVILAGGMGTRLQPYTFFLPKPMLPIGDKPLLEHLLQWLKENGVTQIVLSVSYMRKTIESYFGEGSEWDLQIEYARSKSPLGIAGQILNVKNLVVSPFYLLYGDSVFDFKISDMLDFHLRNKSVLTIGLMYYRQKLPYGVIERDESGRVKTWNEKPEVGGLINVGCYVADATVFKYIPEGKMYGFDDVVRDMISSGERVYSYVIEGKEFVDIGDETSFKRAYEVYLQKMGKVL